MCKVFKLNESYSLSPFYVVTDANGNEHIASLASIVLNTPGVKVIIHVNVVFINNNK